MDHFAGPDVSVKETSVCIVEETGKIIREAKVASEPEALLAALANPAYHFKRIGLEAGRCRNGCTALWPKRVASDLCRDPAHAGSIEGTDYKTDRNDARGIAQM